MKDKKIRQLNILVLLLVLAGFVISLIFTFVMAPESADGIKIDSLSAINDNWTLRSLNEDDRIVSLPVKLKAGAGEIIQIIHAAPEDVTDDTVLCFRTSFQNVTVSINDSKVYSSGVMNGQRLMRNAVPQYNLVELSGVRAGDLISISFASGYNRYSGRLPSISYGSKGDVISDIVSKNAAGFVFAATLLLITIILTVSLILIRNVQVDKRKAGYGFGFILAVILWSITGNYISELFINNKFGMYMTNMLLLMAMPVLYLMYQRCFTLKRRYARIFEIGIYVFSINFLIGTVFQIVGVCDFATYMVFTKIIITIGLLLLSFIMYLAADTYRDKTIYSNFWANIVLTAACIAEASLSLFRFYSSYRGTVLQLGVYIFMVMLIITVEKSIINEMNAKHEMVIGRQENERKAAIQSINTKLIFESLNRVIGTLKEKDKKSSKAIYDTSVFMKYNLNSISEDKVISFSREMDYIKAYLGIQKEVNPDLEVSIEDKVTDFKVPNSTIEPLVENAVINGALKARTAKRLVVRSYERLDCYAIQIVDNGRGQGPDKTMEREKYRVIRKRLKEACGAVIEIKTNAEKGTILTIKLPKSGFVVKEH